MFYRTKTLNLGEFKLKLGLLGIETRVYPDHMEFVLSDGSKFTISVSEKSPELEFSGTSKEMKPFE